MEDELELELLIVADSANFVLFFGITPKQRKSVLKPDWKSTLFHFFTSTDNR